MITERKSTRRPKQKSTQKSTQTRSSLSLRGVTKRFGSLLAVDDLSVTIPKGSFFALLGPSGCGKTTTLRMVAGLEEPDSGDIRLSGLDITHTRPHKRPVNTVFQSYALFPHLNIFENVAFGLRRRGHKKVQAAVMDALDLVELPQLARRRPGQLSGGQQQRIALARAIVNQPQILLLDEPMGALDLKLRRQMQLELKRIQTEVGITFLHVTHDQEEAMTMADTVAVMNRGRIEQLGTPTDLYESPATTFVANFLGQSNLLPGLRAGDLGQDLMVDVHGNKLRVPRSRVRSQDNALMVGVRPEKIRLCATAEFIPESCNQLTSGVVLDVSFAGVSTQYVVRMPWRQDLTVFSQNLGVGERFPAGSQVTVAWEPEHTFGLPRDPNGDGPNHVDANSRGN
jgi:spermidine/putrescine transport system ATP-binding protein